MNSAEESGIADVKATAQRRELRHGRTRFPLAAGIAILAMVVAGAMCSRAPAPATMTTAEDAVLRIADSVPPVLVGAGDIASCGSAGDEATAALLDSIPGIVFTAGDNVYSRGSAAEFAKCYEPSWGRHKHRTFPAPGNHDYKTSDGRDYFAYFGSNAGEPGSGYYRYSIGEWDVLVLNSEIDTGPWSIQLRWLRAQLATTPRRCQVAIMHYPRFSSGSHGGNRRVRAIWEALYDGNTDVVIAGHDHIYERFAPQTPDAVADSARGIREFIVGTGGRDLYPLRARPERNSEVRYNQTFGVLALTLHATSYDWRYIPVVGARFSDSGTGACH